MAGNCDVISFFKEDPNPYSERSIVILIGASRASNKTSQIKYIDQSPQLNLSVV